MQFSKAIEGYIFSAIAEGYSFLTLAAYRSALSKLVEFIEDKKVSDITIGDLRGFMGFLVTDYRPERRNNPSKTKPLSTASHHRYWKAMRSFEDS